MGISRESSRSSTPRQVPLEEVGDGRSVSSLASSNMMGKTAYLIQDCSLFSIILLSLIMLLAQAFCLFGLVSVLLWEGTFFAYTIRLWQSFLYWNIAPMVAAIASLYYLFIDHISMASHKVSFRAVVVLRHLEFVLSLIRTAATVDKVFRGVR
jgi:hypothetical protein